MRQSIGSSRFRNWLRYFIGCAIYAALGAVVIAAVSLWLRLGWPPPVLPEAWTLSWCMAFAAVMLATSQVYWKIHSLRELVGTLLATIVIVFAAGTLGPLALNPLAPPEPSEPVIPLSSVNP